METRLLTDYRYLTLDYRNRLLFLEILMFLRITNNRIPNNLDAIEKVLRTELPSDDLRVRLDVLKSTFPKFKSNKHFYYMDGWDERFNREKLNAPKNSQNKGVDEDEDIDEDKDKEKRGHYDPKTRKSYSPKGLPPIVEEIKKHSKRGAGA